jgi:hypothetical protein
LQRTVQVISIKGIFVPEAVVFRSFHFHQAIIFVIAVTVSRNTYLSLPFLRFTFRLEIKGFKVVALLMRASVAESGRTICCHKYVRQDLAGKTVYAH